MRHRSRALVIEGLDKIAEDLPFPLLGMGFQQRQRFHDPRRLRLLRGASACADALASLQEERSVNVG